MNYLFWKKNLIIIYLVIIDGNNINRFLDVFGIGL